MKVVIPERLVAEIRRHGEATYPEECCGFLVAEDAPSNPAGIRTIVRVAAAENRVRGTRERRFVIPPEELQGFEKTLEGTGELLAGFYHSHPDHPASPSAFDRENAWPWYIYFVLAVQRGRAGELGAFDLDPEERQFKSVPWALAPSEPPAR